MFSSFTYGKTRNFNIYLFNIPQEACIELVTMDWKSKDGGFLGVAGIAGVYAADKQWCTNATSFNIPVPLDEAINFCPYDYNDIGLVFE